MKNVAEPKIILITGCSSGFGLLTAARLASRGHRVIATMRDLNKKGALLEEMKWRKGELNILQLDVTDKKSIKNAVTEIAGKYGYVDVLVNNAGYGLGGFFEDMTEEEIRQQFETNFFGAQNLTREIIQLMRPRRKGKIINISSIAGLYAGPCFGAYNASKWALEAFSESLRYELKFFGIDVLLVEPGTYKTKIFYENARYAANFHNENSPYYPISKFLENRTREYVNDCYKDPEDVAALVEKLINTAHPSFRNIPDIEAKVLYFLRKFLPFRLYSSFYTRAMFKGFKLPK
jgi:NAD(P)-dependent dehydrogenase (short-subunit alcohol dehydrogenase family)